MKYIVASFLLLILCILALGCVLTTEQPCHVIIANIRTEFLRFWRSK